MKFSLMKFWVELQLTLVNIITKESHVFGFGQFNEIFHMLYIISSFSISRNSGSDSGLLSPQSLAGLGLAWLIMVSF